MRGKSFIPRDYDVFSGLDVSKKSMSVTFTNHQGFIRSLNMPHKAEPLLRYVRKHFATFVYEAGPTGYGLHWAGPGIPVDIDWRLRWFQALDGDATGDSKP